MQRRRANPHPVDRARHCRDTIRCRRPRLGILRICFRHPVLKRLPRRVTDVFDLVASPAADQDTCVRILAGEQRKVRLDDRWVLLKSSRLLHECNDGLVLFKVPSFNKGFAKNEPMRSNAMLTLLPLLTLSKLLFCVCEQRSSFSQNLDENCKNGDFT